jgi:hypothetical protein
MLAVCGCALLSVGTSAGADGEITVSPLTIHYGAATGTISGFRPGEEVDVEGEAFVADSDGVVRFTDLPLTEDSDLSVGFEGEDGEFDSVESPLRSALDGAPLGLDQLFGSALGTTAGASFNRPRSGSSSGGTTNGAAAGGSGGGGGGGSAADGQPQGLQRTPAGALSVPATSVVGPVRLVVDSIAFTPRSVRTRAPIRALVRIKDSRGYLVRGALVYMRGVPERRLSPMAETATDGEGLVAMTLKSTRFLPLKKGARLTVFLRARVPGESTTGNTSVRRLVSLPVSPSR